MLRRPEKQESANWRMTNLKVKKNDEIEHYEQTLITIALK